MKSTIQPVKGTRDFYPEEMAFRTWLYNLIREVSELFGYQEYEGPCLEKLELYAAKSGEELVKEQAFVFEDRGGGEITLRPELTPTLARMVAQKQNQLVYPLRWWSFGPFWRYERPQKGRTRAFFQWNIDAIGVSSPEMDAELIAVCATLFKKAGLSSDQVKIYVNNRRLMDSVLEEMGLAGAMKSNVFRLIDRKDKLSADAWKKYALDLGLTEEQINGLLEVLSNQDLWKKSEEITRVFKALDYYGVADYIAFDPQVIRGLDYYTGVVFEARDADGTGRAVLGGGHYDNLVADVGGDPLPGVGFAMGDVMFPVVLEKYGITPETKPIPADVLVTVFDETLQSVSVGIASRLRNAGINTICVNETSKMNKQFKFANRIGVKLVITVGPDENEKNEVSVKNLLTREQVNISVDEIETKIKEMLAQV
jgi:histidyl-tRNA synthetase